MYVLTMTVNNEIKYFSSFSYNGIFTDSDIHKSVIFSSSTLATNQSTILSTIDNTKTFVVKEITLQDIN